MKGHVIANPFVLPKARTDNDIQAARIRLGMKPSDRIVGNAGWLIARKRWDVFLDVAAGVARRAPKVRFLIAGDGPDRGVLQRQAERLGIAEQIRWLGWREDLTDFYLALDVMLFNSDFDALGRAPLEAMSHGVPLVASVVHCGLPEVVDSDEVGFLLHSHDIPTLRDRVIQLLRDDDAARALGHRGRLRVAETGCPKRRALNILKALGVEGLLAQPADIGNE